MSTTKKKVLIIEDNDLLREIFVEYINTLNVEVQTAANGTEGYLVVLNQKPEIIITDMTMAGGNGLELLIKVNQMPSYNPKIFVTSGSNDLTSEQIEKFKIIKVFEKPFDGNFFIKIIASHLN